MRTSFARAELIFLGFLIAVIIFGIALGTTLGVPGWVVSATGAVTLVTVLAAMLVPEI